VYFHGLRVTRAPEFQNRAVSPRLLRNFYTSVMVAPPNPSVLLESLKSLILSARQAAARGVNLLQVYTNYEVGRRIVEQEQRGADRAEYGKQLLKDLAKHLAAEFGNGFSRSNLEYMRRFYLTYPNRGKQISQTLSGELSVPFSPLSKSHTVSGISTTDEDRGFTLSWSHYVFLLGLEEPQRAFYEIEASQQGWTLRELKRQFNAGLYERLALSRDQASIRNLSRQGQQVAKPQDLLKEPYVLEFLGLEERASYSESDLETAIVDHVERFLLELGKGFLFEARQKRFTFDERHFFVDLVLYNRLLRCYVLVDLKIGELTHQDLGQMQMYVNYFDRFLRTEAENSTVGIVLCKSKNEALVEITLPKDANIHAREYQLYLPSKAELQRKLTEWIASQGESDNL
jgi:predicted nuclease of restriction endonuclease-like (RecB) superfamily